ncbi:hypothetical protein PG990_004107 [Apiospora arundinis]
MSLPSEYNPNLAWKRTSQVRVQPLRKRRTHSHHGQKAKADGEPSKQNPRSKVRSVKVISGPHDPGHIDFLPPPPTILTHKPAATLEPSPWCLILGCDTSPHCLHTRPSEPGGDPEFMRDYNKLKSEALRGIWDRSDKDMRQIDEENNDDSGHNGYNDSSSFQPHPDEGYGSQSSSPSGHSSGLSQVASNGSWASGMVFPIDHYKD